MAFQPISAYGFIGNLASGALVSTNGSIDWCCLPLLDSPSIFAGILDDECGGSFAITPVKEVRVTEQAYVPDTNILRTVFMVDGGTLELLDWMHMGGFEAEEHEEHRLPALYRLLQCSEGTVEMQMRCDPRPDYGRARATVTATPDGLLIQSHDDCLRLHTRVPLHFGKTGATAQFTLMAGESASFVLAYGNCESGEFPPVGRSLEKTTAYWRRWVEESGDGFARPKTAEDHMVTRSSLVLKILAGGNGIAAAATTSLPEVLGQSDNWDYRFHWIRDASFTIQALTSLGHFGDAREFLGWLSELLLEEGRRPADLRVLYPLHGSALPMEEVLTHLRGYRDSAPVRIGNAAAEQHQLDIYGEVLETVFRSEHLHPGVDNVLSGVLRTIVDYVCDVWREPDHGIWELRREPQHHTYSKVMCWVAIDRGIRLAEEHGWKVDLRHWKEERAAIHAMILAEGFHPKRKAFTQAFSSDVLDATALLFPILEFLPPDHPSIQSTLQAIEKHLTDGALVYRSEEHRGREGAFGLCSFWLVDALIFAGRIPEAQERFQALLQFANHVGLYAEEIDPRTGEFLGNFPQAFTHVGLINSAIYLARAEGRETEHPLMGEENLPSS